MDGLTNNNFNGAPRSPAMAPCGLPIFPPSPLLRDEKACHGSNVAEDLVPGNVEFAQQRQQQQPEAGPEGDELLLRRLSLDDDQDQDQKRAKVARDSVSSFVSSCTSEEMNQKLAQLESEVKKEASVLSMLKSRKGPLFLQQALFHRSASQHQLNLSELQREFELCDLLQQQDQHQVQQQDRQGGQHSAEDDARDRSTLTQPHQQCMRLPSVASLLDSGLAAEPCDVGESEPPSRVSSLFDLFGRASQEARSFTEIPQPQPARSSSCLVAPFQCNGDNESSHAALNPSAVSKQQRQKKKKKQLTKAVRSQSFGLGIDIDAAPRKRKEERIGIFTKMREDKDIETSQRVEHLLAQGLLLEDYGSLDESAPHDLALQLPSFTRVDGSQQGSSSVTRSAAGLQLSSTRQASEEGLERGRLMVSAALLSECAKVVAHTPEQRPSLHHLRTLSLPQKLPQDTQIRDECQHTTYEQHDPAPQYPSRALSPLARSALMKKQHQQQLEEQRQQQQGWDGSNQMDLSSDILDLGHVQVMPSLPIADQHGEASAAFCVRGPMDARDDAEWVAHGDYTKISPTTSGKKPEHEPTGHRQSSLKPEKKQRPSSRGRGGAQEQVCPVCLQKGRKSQKRICGCCYSGVYNDIQKYLRRNLSRVHSGDVSIADLAVGLRTLPRGCKRGYRCGVEQFTGAKGEKCTRCRSIHACRTIPELVEEILQRAITKEQEKHQTYLHN